MKKTNISPSLFAVAKEAAPEKTAKKDDHVTVVVKEKEHAGFSEKLNRLNQLRDMSAELEAEAKMLEGEVKQVARGKFLSLYKERGFPGSFRIVGEGQGCFLVIPMDRYPRLTKETAEQFAGNFGSDTVEIETTYSFNTEVLKRNEAVISELILNSKEISDADKAGLIIASTTYDVAKGLIKNLLKFGERLAEVFATIQPVFQLKNCK